MKEGISYVCYSTEVNKWHDIKRVDEGVLVL